MRVLRPTITPGTRVRGELYPGDMRWKRGELVEATFMAWDEEGDAAVDLDGEVTYLQGGTLDLEDALADRVREATAQEERSVGRPVTVLEVREMVENVLVMVYEIVTPEDQKDRYRQVRFAVYTPDGETQRGTSGVVSMERLEVLR